MTADEHERVKLALLTIAEAVASTGRHAGFSGAKRLPSEIENILSGETALPKPEADDSDSSDDEQNDEPTYPMVGEVTER